MKSEIKLLMDKHYAGNKLTLDEVSELMVYALELLKDIENQTKANIARLTTL